MRKFFAHLDEKENVLKTLRRFSKILKKFRKKIAKNALVSRIFK